MAFSIFAKLHNHHRSLIPEHFNHPKKKPHAHWSSFSVSLSPQAPTTMNLLDVSMNICPFWVYHRDEIIHRWPFVTCFF